DRRIEMGARSFTERRENQGDGRAAHRNACQHTSCKLAGDEIQNWRTRMMKQNGEQPGRDHEQPELGCLAKIFGPMLAGCPGWTAAILAVFRRIVHGRMPSMFSRIRYNPLRAQR